MFLCEIMLRLGDTDLLGDAIKLLEDGLPIVNDKDQGSALLDLLAHVKSQQGQASLANWARTVIEESLQKVTAAVDRAGREPCPETISAAKAELAAAIVTTQSMLGVLSDEGFAALTEQAKALVNHFQVLLSRFT